MTVRPLRADDAAGVAALWRRLDAPARRRFTDLAHLPSERAGDVALPRPGHAAGIVATTPAGSVAGVARYERTAGDTAGFLLFVDASWRRAGLGTVLLRRLAEAARHAGVRRLAGDLPEGDVAMRGLLAELGLEYTEQVTAATVHASFAVQETDAYLDAVLADQRAAARVAVGPFLRPGSIALVGASDKPGSVGELLMANLLNSGFAGPVYPVTPRHQVIRGMTCYPELAACPTRPDLALVAVPAPAVAGVVDQAGALGVRAVCVISAGFAEIGGQGRVLQDELLRRARAAGVRLIGPNCMGLLNGGPEPRFNATFSAAFPPPGHLAFVTQSGGLGLAALALLNGPSLGISGFVSVGNTVDLTPNDLFLYWDEDPGAHVVLAYLESVPDPRRFARIARRISRHQPVVAVKAGRTGAGRRAASSHTAALAAGETAVEALFHQAGVIRAGTLEEMFDVAAVLSAQPVPAGRRVAVLTNGGGPGILVADACEAAGLLVPELSDDTQPALRAGLPPQASVRNPVDTVASATAEQYGQALRLLGAAEEIDAIIAVYIPAFVPAEDVAREITAAAAALPATPVLAVFLISGPAPASLSEAGIPVFTYPEEAAAALGRIARWAEWRARPAGHVVTPPGIDPGAGRAVVGEVLAGQPGGGWASAEAAAQLLAAYGIPAARSRVARTPAQAAAAQAELGGPVAVKIAAAIHKSDVGGVALGITTPQAAADAVTAIRARLSEAGLGGQAAEFLVQEQIRDGVEMIVGVTHDPAFGPLVLAGLGGTAVEVLGDVAVRITPLSDTDVDEMLRSLRSYRLLTVFVLPAILAGVPVSRGLVHTALLGLGGFVLYAICGVILLRTERPLAALGRAAQRLYNWVTRGHRPPLTGLDTRLLAERDTIRTVLGEKWWQAVLLTAGRLGFDYGCLLAALRATGAEPQPSLVLLAYSAAGIIGLFPLTPGGLGIVEASLSGLLILAGTRPAYAFLATLAYRVASYWLPLLAGLPAYLLFRHRYGRPAPQRATPAADTQP